MTDPLVHRVLGRDMAREDGPEKVTGTAPYAFEQLVEAPVHLHPVCSVVARGQVEGVDTAQADAVAGVLQVLTPDNAPQLASTEDAELAVLQDPEVRFRGQFVGAVVAETPEAARHAADLVRVRYRDRPHDAHFSADRDDLYAPDKVNGNYATDTAQGDVDRAMRAAEHTLDATYSTARCHNNPMEPHASIVDWEPDRAGAGRITVYDSTQSVHGVREALARVLGVEVERLRVVCPHVGGGFGAKGQVHAHVVLAAMASSVVRRPVKFALTRQQMFDLVGYRSPTIQRVRLACDSQGKLQAISNDTVVQTSRFKEFAEQAAQPTRALYAAPNRSTSHRLAALDVPVPSWMRAPGECPGMFAPEVAVDELAVELGIDPVELRLRNEPTVHPESGHPFSTRNLVPCLREGAYRFGWDQRDPAPGVRVVDGWQYGTGVASSFYPVNRNSRTSVAIRYGEETGYTVLIGAADLGTGAWTVLTQIAADALGVDVADIDLHLGDTDFPFASVAGGSSGTTTWGSAIVQAARAFRERFGLHPRDGEQIEDSVPDNPYRRRFAMAAFGAQFAEVAVRVDSGEVRVPRLLGVFAAGRILNPRTARSQLVGGMTMGLSMALHEQSVLDERFGHVINRDFAQYHVASNADVGAIEATWIDERDAHVNPMGSKGIGEIGITGTAAAIANAAHHATGTRVRDLPLTLDKFLV